MDHREPERAEVAAEQATEETARPPVKLLYLAAAAALLAWAVVPAEAPAVRLAGWALGSLVVMSLVTAYTVIDAGRRLAPGYLPGRAARPILVAAVVAGVAAAGLNAFAYATWAAS